MMSSQPAPLPRLIVDEAVKTALLEDLGRAGDITTNSVITADAQAKAVIATREEGRLAGLDLAEAAFRLIDPGVSFRAEIQDGSEIVPGQAVAMISGAARSILSAERVALNFLGHLSGIATATGNMTRQVAGTKAVVCDTRKTTPGLRIFEKYAVRCGGGANHRFGLDDAVLIKDNHIAAAGGVAKAISAARANAGHMVKIEIEVDTFDQLREAMELQPDAVLLDNMCPDALQEAVKFIDGRAITEASGGITETSIGRIAGSGVDLISVGGLTHSAKTLDLGLDFQP